ncbi:uncharacterized protein [Narcine bancroftii]|uniref:uncharacterized protein n=1 Tax=Narcine bancroftii TaxID=1343680 RepID=UPI003832130D
MIMTAGGTSQRWAHDLLDTLDLVFMLPCTTNLSILSTEKIKTMPKNTETKRALVEKQLLSPRYKSKDRKRIMEANSSTRLSHKGGTCELHGEGLVVRGGTTSKPGGDAVVQAALHTSSVEYSEDGGWEMDFPQPSQGVEELLDSFGYGAGVRGPATRMEAAFPTTWRLFLRNGIRGRLAFTCFQGPRQRGTAVLESWRNAGKTTEVR